MEPKPWTLDDMFRERVLRAAQAAPGEKLLDGPRLFDFACMFAESGIRGDKPGISDEEVVEEIKRRLAIGERLERASLRAIHEGLGQPR